MEQNWHLCSQRISVITTMKEDTLVLKIKGPKKYIFLSTHL